MPEQRAGRPTRPRPRWRSPGSWGDRQTGAAPAASAYELRRALALFGLVFCGVVGGLFVIHGHTVMAAVLLAIATTALVDLVVIHRRMAAARRDNRPHS